MFVLVASFVTSVFFMSTSQVNAATVVGGSVSCRGISTVSVAASPGESFTLEFTDEGPGRPGRCNDAAIDWDTNHFSSVSIPRRVDIDPAAGVSSPFSVTFTLSTSIPIGTVTNIRLWDGVVFGNPIPVTIVAPSHKPPPWWQSTGRTADSACPLGWGASWAAWAQPVTGGWVCNRVVFWNGTRWMQAADLDNTHDAAIWDGK